MRHVRILNLFISNILPLQPIRKSVATCLGCGRFQLSPVFRPFSTTPKYVNLPPNARPAEPSIAITKLSRQGRPSEALAVYLQLIQDGGFPSRESLYQLTRAMYYASHLQGMFAIHDTLLSYFSIHPLSKRNARSMIYMYTMLINLIVKHKPINMDSIRGLCKEMSHFTDHTNIVLYNTLIKALLDNDQVTQADAIYQDLLRNKVDPNIITFTILMKSASKRKDHARLLQYFDEIKRRKLHMDYPVVSIVTHTLCDIREFDMAVRVVEALHFPRTMDSLSSPKYKTQLLRSIESRRKKERHQSKKRNREKSSNLI